MEGHQYDHTIRLPRFVFRNCFKKTASEEVAEKPAIINAIYVASETYFNVNGMYALLNALLRCLSILLNIKEK